jgi:hypothetical protein
LSKLSNMSFGCFIDIKKYLKWNIKTISNSCIFIEINVMRFNWHPCLNQAIKPINNAHQWICHEILPRLKYRHCEITNFFFRNLLFKNKAAVPEFEVFFHFLVTKYFKKYSKYWENLMFYCRTFYSLSFGIIIYSIDPLSL